MLRGTTVGETLVIRRLVQASALMLGAWLVVSPLTATGAGASTSTPPFDAVGSTEQVYVTGLAPSARMSLITPGGQTLDTRGCRLARWSAVP